MVKVAGTSLVAPRKKRPSKLDDWVPLQISAWSFTVLILDGACGLDSMVNSEAY